MEGSVNLEKMERDELERYAEMLFKHLMRMMAMWS